MRGGEPENPICRGVERLRNGRSFVTRRVVARQSVGVILTMSASFQVDEAGHDVQIAAMPEIPGHAELVDTSWSPMFDRRFVSPRGPEEGREIGRASCRERVCQYV